MDLAPWMELKLIPYDDVINTLAAQDHRRFIKSHAPADTLNIQPQVKYIFLARDGRDVIWSWYKHMLNMKDETYDALNAIPGREGPPLVKPSCTVHEFFYQWMEESGLYDWSYWDHIQSWWNIRDLPNVRIFHFNNLKADLAGEIREMAAFLGIEIDESKFPDIVHHCTFDYMKENADDLSDIFDQIFQGGLKNFIYKGTNRRWVDTLTPEDIALYEKVVSEHMTPDCAHWHATGEMPA